MRRPALALPVVLAALLAAVPAAGAAGAGPGLLSPGGIVAYHDSGRWDAAIAAQAKQARAYLERRVRQNRAAKRRARLGIVLDIDDTSLSTYACQKRAGGFTSVTLATCVIGGRLPAVPPTLALYRLALRRGVRVTFVTGRPAAIRDLTVRNLRRAGYTGRHTLVLRPAGDSAAHPTTLVPYKTASRRASERGGTKIVVNVGDQQSDLTGGFAARTFKYPNPMYYTP